MTWVSTLFGPLLARLAGLFKSKSEKIDIAIAQGYKACRKHYPPRIMLSWGSGWWKCPECNNILYDGPTWSSSIAGRRHPIFPEPQGIRNEEKEER